MFINILLELIITKITSKSKEIRDFDMGWNELYLLKNRTYNSLNLTPKTQLHPLALK